MLLEPKAQRPGKRWCLPSLQKNILIMRPVLHDIPVRTSAMRGTLRSTPVLPVLQGERGCTLLV